MAPASPPGRARLSPTGALVWIDPAGAHVAGFDSVADALRAHEVPALDRARAWAARPDAVLGPVHLEVEWQAAAGELRRAGLLVVPSVDAAGRATGFEVFLQDLAAQERGEPEATHRFLHSILEALPNPVFVKDEQHRWVLLNDSYCQFMGHDRAELLGRSDYDFFPPEEAEVFWAKDDAVFRSGELNENEEAFTDSRACEHVILTRKTLHVDSAGRRFLVGVITDITQRKQMERELRRSRDELEHRVRQRTAELQLLNAQLEEQDRRKNDFLGMLSHELRNPLEPILNALHILDRAAPGGEQAAAARAVIGRQLGHLRRLVDDLLDVTRVSRGKIQLHLQRADLRSLVSRAAEDHRGLFARRGLALRVQLPAEPLVAEVDLTRLTQIVGNLLQNSAKFTGSGGTVALSLERAGPNDAVVRVRDDGIGISEEMLPRVFDPFTQADDSLDRSSGGLGLGLSLVKALAELQGGSVEARSEGPGSGAELTVRLPLVAGPPEPEAPPAVAVAPRSRRVLIVEDSPDAAETLRVMLEMGGHAVEVAHDGREGLARARAFRPEVVLCDLGLPELDGFQVARALRADPLLAGATLVAISGYALPEDVRRAAEAGFDRHLAKPVPLEEIDEVLQAASPRAPGRGGPEGAP